MVKRRVYTTSHVGGKLQLSFEDQGSRHQVLHELPDRPAAGAQQWHFFRNMSRKQWHKHITVLLQPLLRRHGDYQSYKLPYKYLSKVTGVPAQQLARGRPGKPKPNLDTELLAAMPEFQQEYLNAHAHLGLPQRVTMMNRTHPESPLSTVYYLRTAYRRLAILQPLCV